MFYFITFLELFQFDCIFFYCNVFFCIFLNVSNLNERSVYLTLHALLCVKLIPTSYHILHYICIRREGAHASFGEDQRVMILLIFLFVIFQ